MAGGHQWWWWRRRQWGLCRCTPQGQGRGTTRTRTPACTPARRLLSVLLNDGALALAPSRHRDLGHRLDGRRRGRRRRPNGPASTRSGAWGRSGRGAGGRALWPPWATAGGVPALAVLVIHVVRVVPSHAPGTVSHGGRGLGLWDGALDLHLTHVATTIRVHARQSFAWDGKGPDG